jgi:hypothetical protein
MNETPEDLQHRLDQLRLLATETTDPLAERLVREMIVELEDRLTADLSQPYRRRLAASSRRPASPTLRPWHFGVYRR